MSTPENKLLVLKGKEIVPQMFNLDPENAKQLQSHLPSVIKEREEYVSQYEEVIRLDINDPETVKRAKALRLKIRNNRTRGIEAWHKTNKEFYLRAGQFIDALKNKEIAINLYMEENLEAIEKYQERQEQLRIEALQKERFSELEQYWSFVPAGLILGTMEEEEYQKVYNGAKLQYELDLRQKQEAEEKARVEAEKERVRSLRMDKAMDLFNYWPERKPDFTNMTDEEFQSFLQQALDSKSQKDEEDRKLREEAERLASEKAAIEEKARQERLAAEKALAEERAKAAEEHRKQQEAAHLEQQRLQKERELAEKAAKEAQEREQRLLEEKRRAEEAIRIAQEQEQLRLVELAKAPTKEQLTRWVDEFTLPNPPNTEFNNTSQDIVNKFNAFKNWAKNEITKL